MHPVRPGSVRHGCCPITESTARRGVWAAQDQELVCQFGKPFEERHAECAAAQKRDPTQH